MKYLFSIIIAVLTLFSCKSFDKKSPEGFAQFIINELVSNNTETIKSFYVLPEDSIFAQDTSAKRAIIRWFEGEGLKSTFIEKQSKQINEIDAFLKTSNFDKSEIQFIKIDVDTQEFDIFGFELFHMKIFFKANNELCVFSLNDLVKLNDTWKFYNLETPFFVKEKVKSLSSESFIPNLYFKEYVTECSRTNSKVLSHFYLTIVNNDIYEIDSIQYSLILKLKNTDQIVYSKKIRKVIKILPEEIFRFEVDELKDLYLDADFSSNNDISCEATIIDAKPSPLLKYYSKALKEN